MTGGPEEIDTTINVDGHLKPSARDAMAPRECARLPRAAPAQAHESPRSVVGGSGFRPHALGAVQQVGDVAKGHVEVGEVVRRMGALIPTIEQAMQGPFRAIYVDLR